MFNRGWIGLLLLTLLAPDLSAQEAGEGRFEVRKRYATRNQALALSALFPGLGQLATGHARRGTAMLVGQVGFMVVWLTSHADYNTQKDQFRLEETRYLSLSEGGSFDEAEESWERLRDKKDDLDGSHSRRRLFGILALGLYGYNLLDVVVLGGAEPPEESAISLAPRLDPAQPGLALVARF